MTRPAIVAGWTILELGQVNRYNEFNFIIYPLLNEAGGGINCKASMFQVASSRAMEFAEKGGTCKIVVKGSHMVAKQWEPGWSSRSIEYIQVDWIALETPESLAQELEAFTRSLNEKGIIEEIKDEDLISEDDAMDEDQEDDGSSFVVSDGHTEEDKEFEVPNKVTVPKEKSKKRIKPTKATKKRSAEELEKRPQDHGSHSDSNLPSNKKRRASDSPKERASV